MVQRTGKKFGSANKAVVVMVPRGGSPNHTADVSLIKTMWNDVGEQGVKWKRDPRNQ
jgi:hypothetical protein